MLVLTVGDVVAESGILFLEKNLKGIKKLYSIDFTIVNGENAAGIGVTKSDTERLYYAGADVITLGNHAFSKREIADFIDDDKYLLRPANMTAKNPGRGYGVYETAGGRRIAVICLMGRAFSDSNLDNPFTVAGDIIKSLDTNIIIVDFHAEATSEKNAMGRFLDGRISALFGTHTHVQTADERVFPKGSGYITDLGMTGPVESVLGMRIDTSVDKFMGSAEVRYKAAEGLSELCGAVFDIDEATGKCRGVERLRIQ